MNVVQEIRSYFKDLEIKKAMLTIVEADGEEANYYYLDLAPDEYQFWREGNMPTNYGDKIQELTIFSPQERGITLNGEN